MPQRKTIEEFIEEARKVHGDKYDYSKVEYVNNHTKVCIICPEHGEFWQQPSAHLMGQGCFHCGCNKRKVWTYDKCYEAAKKCCTKKEFETKDKRAYNAALKNKWLDDYTWFVEVKKPNGYWTYETCCKEAKKYSTKSEFRKMASRAYSLSLQNGWINEYTWLEEKYKPSGYWTYDRCYQEAKKYKVKKEFQEKSSGAFFKARKRGWLCDYIWFNEFRKPHGYWTYEMCFLEAKKYETKNEFQRKSSGAYHVALANKWLDDYTWLIDGRVKLFTDKIDSVYAYEFPDNTAYVGRTLMKLQEARHIRHTTQGPVSKYAKSHNLEMPQMKVIEDNLTLEEGLQREDYWVNWYKEHGYNVLNKAKTGVGCGSLGRISSGKWNYESCYEEAKKYKTRTEFCKKKSNAYEKANKMGWSKDYTWFVRPPQKPNGYWNIFENVECESKKYRTKREFCKGCRGAYDSARKHKWLDILFPPKENS